MESYRKFGATDLLMLLAIVFWAINFSFIKIALREFSPLGFNGFRLLYASLIFVIILLITKDGFSFPRRDIWKFVALGLIGNTAYQMFFIHGLNLTTASNTAIIIAMSPAIIALLSSLVKHEKLNWAAWIGVLISFLGFFLVIAKQPGDFQLAWESMKGDLMILFGNLTWALYTVFSKPLLERYSPLKLTSLTMIVGTVFYLPFCFKDMIHLKLNEISLQAWAALFYSGLFALVICYIIWYASVKRVGNSRTAIYDNFMPILTILFAYVFISERITFLQAGGALIILMGVYLTRTGYRFFNK